MTGHVKYHPLDDVRDGRSQPHHDVLTMQVHHFQLDSSCELHLLFCCFCIMQQGTPQGTLAQANFAKLKTAIALPPCVDVIS